MHTTTFDIQEYPSSAFNDESEPWSPRLSERLDTWLSLTALGLVWVSGAMALWW